VRTVYIAREAATVRREGNVLQVHVRGEATADVPVYDLHKLVLMGTWVLTPAALDCRRAWGGHGPAHALRALPGGVVARDVGNVG
jgi:hypothetical protein